MPATKLLSGSIALLLPLFVAATDAVAQSSANKGGLLEEIVVTATKREVNAQDVPITITAINGENLAKLGVESLDELPLVAPGLHYGRVVGASVVLLRGVGTNNAAPGNEPSVATYVDGVYQPDPNVNIGNFVDIERIEVLKGPQGTLFGRNATGGLIHIITKDPTQEPEARLKLGYGNYDTFEGSFYGSAGITDTLAGNVAISYKDAGESFMDNVAPGADDFLPERDFLARGKLLYTPSEKLELKLIGYYADSESSYGTARTPRPGARSQSGEAHIGDFNDIANDTPSYAKFLGRGASVQIRYSFDAMDLVSISSWAKNKQRNAFDNDASSTKIQNSFGHIPVEIYTQELRLVSTNDTRFNWIGGVYFFDMKNQYTPLYVQLRNLPFFSNYAEQKTTSWAGFGEMTIELHESTNLIIGLRQTRDKQEFQGQTFFGANPVFPYTEMDEKFKKTTWRFGLDHHATDNLLVYTTFSRGYKTGLYNLVTLAGRPQPALQPEVLDAWEAGFKWDGLFGGRVRVNGALFDYDYTDLQLVTIGNTSQSTANAAAATIRGAEIEIVADVTDRLSGSFAYAYTHAEFDEYFGRTNRPAPSGNGNVGVNADFSGNQLFRTPDFTVTTALDYRVPTSSGEFDFSVNLYYNDGFFWDEDNRVPEDSYTLVNAEVAWTDPSEKWTLAVWGRNLTDEKYSVYTNNSPSSGDAYMPAEPTMYGASVSYKFF